MAGEIKKFVVNGVLVSVFILVATKLLGWVSGLHALIQNVLAFPQAAWGWTIGLTVAAGLAVMASELIKNQFPKLK